MKIILASPRGFCAGVKRAILCVERAIELYGAPVYVLNDIVHNKAVVKRLADKGTVFVKDLGGVPRGAHVLFSAHGVGPAQYALAKQQGLQVIDATCPLVEKVHREAHRSAKKGHTVILIGERGHDEVVGTKGWAPTHVRVLLTCEEAEVVEVPDETRVSYVTQTTLSADDCQTVIDVLRRRFPAIEGPAQGNICYATQNRQSIVNALASQADLVLVVGDHTSANSTRLANICASKGKTSHLISSYRKIEDRWLEDVETVVITSGASVPESLVREVVTYLQSKASCDVEEVQGETEDVHFKLPQTIALPSDETPRNKT